jgi:hypothetical protein
MNVNVSTSSSHSQYIPLSPADKDQIEKDALKNSVNLAVTPAEQPASSDDVLKSFYKAGKAAEKIEEQKPQSLLSKMVQWFNRVILRKQNTEETDDNAAENYNDRAELPLQKPEPLTSEMMDELCTVVQEVNRLKSDEMDEIRDEKDLYKMLVKSMLRHHQNTAQHRVNDGHSVLSTHEEVKVLQTKRRELKLNSITLEKQQKFWNRVNLGFTTAFALASAAAYFASGGLLSTVTLLQGFAAMSTGGGQIISAGIKKSSDSLAGESKVLEEEISGLQTLTANELKVVNASAEALLKLFKLLAETNQKHDQVTRMSLSNSW